MNQEPQFAPIVPFRDGQNYLGPNHVFKEQKQCACTNFNSPL